MNFLGYVFVVIVIIMWIDIYYNSLPHLFERKVESLLQRKTSLLHLALAISRGEEDMRTLNFAKSNTEIVLTKKTLCCFESIPFTNVYVKKRCAYRYYVPSYYEGTNFILRATSATRDGRETKHWRTYVVFIWPGRARVVT